MTGVSSLTRLLDLHHPLSHCHSHLVFPPSVFPCQQSELLSPPSDGVTSVHFSPSPSAPSLLLTSSWDCTARLHNADTCHLLSSTTHPSPLLDLCWSSDPTTAFTSTLTGSLYSLDLLTSTLTPLPSPHTNVRSVAYHTPTSLLISAGWDGLLSTHDPRTPTPPYAPCHLPTKLFSLSADSHSPLLLVAGAARSLYTFDLRSPSTPTSTRTSSLSHQTRAIRLIPSPTPSLGFALSTLSGRIAIDYLTPSNTPFAFKAHRVTVAGGQRAHPVNALAFHPGGGVLATGGGEGGVGLWDVGGRRRMGGIWQGGHGGVVALDWSVDGTRLAVACGDGGEWGDAVKGVEGSKVVIRSFDEGELQPKRK